MGVYRCNTCHANKESHESGSHCAECYKQMKGSIICDNCLVRCENCDMSFCTLHAKERIEEFQGLQVCDSCMSSLDKAV